jgi:hypothetical protein
VDRLEHIELRRSSRFGHFATGSLSCARCDAPVALHGPASPSEELACPFCDHSAPLRDFLSLAAPPRPAVVRLSIRPA